MMKNTMMGACLLLWILAVIPRYSYADPIVLGKSENQGVEAIVGMTKSLTEAIKWFQDNMVNSTAFDEAIANMKEHIDKLPADVATQHKELLQTLYKAQVRTDGTRTYLEKIAEELKSQCDQLIAMYNRNDVTVEFLGYSVTRFLKLARNTRVLLEDAMKSYQGTLDNLSNTKALLNSYHIEFQIKKQKHTEHIKKKENDFTIVYWTLGIGTLGIGLIIAAPIMETQRKNLYNVLGGLQKSIKEVKNIQADLLGKVNKMNGYIKDEMKLIDEWKIKLGTSLSDHEDGITKNDLKYAKVEIIANLNDLKDACINYLNHGKIMI